MRYLIAILILAATAASAATLQRDSNGVAIQSPAYDGAKTTALTVVRTTVDMSGDIYYSVYCASAAQERALPFASYTTTARRANFKASTVPATTWHGGAVNRATPYLNFSGCVGTVRRH